MKIHATDGLKAMGTILTIAAVLLLISVIVVVLLIGIGNPFFPILLILATALFIFDILWQKSKG
jgi:hypothetical protein